MLDPVLVEKLIKAARTAPVAFAFGLGATPDKCVMAADKVKDGKVLFELCRKEGGARKGAYGTALHTDGGVVFTCDKDDVPALAKIIQAYFKANKINLRVEAVVAADAEPRGAEEGPPAPADVSPADREPSGAEDVAPEAKIYDPPTIIALIRRARTQAFPFAFGFAGERPLLAVHPRMDAARLARLIRGDGVRRGVWGSVQLDGSVAVFTCEKDPFPGVKKGIRDWFKEQRLAAKFRIQGPAGEFEEPDGMPSEPDETAAADAPRLRGLIAAWNRAVDEVDRQLDSLVVTLRQTRENDLLDIADMIPHSVFGNTRTVLTASLMDLARAPAGAHADIAAKASAAVKRLRGHLAADPQVRACDNNPFGVRVSLQATLAEAMDEIEAALAADFG